MSIGTTTRESPRTINKRAVLNSIRREGPTSRADLARQLKLSKVTISSVVDDLLESGLVVEQGAQDASPRGGRKPIPIALNDNAGFVIGADIGTTNMVVAAGNLRGAIVDEVRSTTIPSHQLSDVIDQFSGQISSLLAGTGLSSDELLGVGVSTAGLVERPAGFVKLSSEFLWHDVPLQNVLAERIGHPVVIDNCTRAMALGEIYYGEAFQSETVFYVNVGYGIGSAIVINGGMYDGHSEFGHTIIRESEERCNCGKYGCLTTLASGHAIERMANGSLQTKGEGWITAEEVARMASDGDDKAREIYRMAGNDLGRGLAIAANLLNPDRIVVGGGVAQAGECFMDPLCETFGSSVMRAIREDLQIQVSKLGMEAGLLGAVALALNTSIFQVARR